MLRRFLLAIVVLPFVAATTEAQFVVSPRAGLVHHLDGEVLVEDQQLHKDGPPFGWVGEGEILRTRGQGRCEVLLAPGSLLRVGRKSSIRLLSNDITSPRLELLDGSAIIDWRTGSEDRPIQLAHGESRIELHKRGLYRLDVHPESEPLLRVFEGQAQLTCDGARVTADRGHTIRLRSGEVEGFNTKQKDSFDVWNQERAQFISKLNSLARSRNQRIADGVRNLFRHLANGQSQTVRRPFHKGSRGLAGHRRRR